MTEQTTEDGLKTMQNRTRLRFVGLVADVAADVRAHPAPLATVAGALLAAQLLLDGLLHVTGARTYAPGGEAMLANATQEPCAERMTKA